MSTFLLPQVPVTSIEQYLATEVGGEGVRRAIELGPAATLEVIDRSGLRDGRGSIVPHRVELRLDLRGDGAVLGGLALSPLSNRHHQLQDVLRRRSGANRRCGRNGRRHRLSALGRRVIGAQERECAQHDGHCHDTRDHREVDARRHVRIVRAPDGTTGRSNRGGGSGV